MKRLAVLTLTLSCRKTCWPYSVRTSLTGAAVGLEFMSSGVSAMPGETDGVAGPASGSRLSRTQLGEPDVVGTVDHPPPAQRMRLAENANSHEHTPASQSNSRNMAEEGGSTSDTGVCVAEEGATETSIRRNTCSATASINDINQSGGSKEHRAPRHKKTQLPVEFTPINAPVRPKWFKWGTDTHNRRWRGLEEHLRQQKYFLKKFKAYAAAGNWHRIHSLHYDWYLFPIEDGSKVEWQVAKGDVATLRQSKEFMDRYRACVQCAGFGWGWDVERRTTVSLPTVC
eukprot:INCI9163.4.p1 GENE.INCI9163.4~~INCI9163.4.p1  ORF type:complete len:285 (-),score=32.59 INCI9163.4:605-1459(-)